VLCHRRNAWHTKDLDDVELSVDLETAINYYHKKNKDVAFVDHCLMVRRLTLT
jgi:hypothetical protein